MVNFPVLSCYLWLDSVCYMWSKILTNQKFKQMTWQNCGNSLICFFLKLLSKIESVILNSGPSLITFHEWPGQNFSLQYQYSIKQRSEIISWSNTKLSITTNIIRNICHTAGFSIEFCTAIAVPPPCVTAKHKAKAKAMYLKARRVSIQISAVVS